MSSSSTDANAKLGPVIPIGQTLVVPGASPPQVVSWNPLTPRRDPCLLSCAIVTSNAPRQEAISRQSLPPRAGPNEEALRRLGDMLDTKRHPAHRKRISRRQRLTRRAIAVLLALAVAVIGGVAGYGWYLNRQITRISVNNLTAPPASGPDANTENILMVGSTSRCALKVQNPAYGLCQGSATSRPVNGVNADVIMILHLNPNKHSISLLSIPRDLFLPNARSGPGGGYKIDAALYQGPSQLVNVIEEDFGIPIQHYVVLNFDTFAGVVNALGGLKMYFPMPVFDAYSGLNVPTAGCISLNGVQALQVVRSRHLQYKGPGVTTDNHAYWPYELQSDLGRIIRDHEFLRVLAAAVRKQGLGNPVTDQSLVAAVAPQLTVDRGFSAVQMMRLVMDFHSVSVSSAPQLTLPVSVGPNQSYVYQGYPKGDVEFPAAVPDQSTIHSFLQIGSSTNTMTGASLPSPSSVTVSVLNGTGSSNQAATTQSALQALGFKGVGVGDFTPLATQSETLVQYSSPSTLGAAEEVMRSMSGAVTLVRGPTADGAQVTVVTGTQFAVDTPTVPTGGTSASSAPGTSAPSTAVTGAPRPSSAVSQAAANAGFQPPSPASSSLKPWDPRSCTASGGAGS